MKPWLDEPSLSVLFAKVEATQLHHRASWRFCWTSLLNHLFPEKNFSVYLCTDNQDHPSLDLRVAGTVSGREIPVLLLDVQAPTNICSESVRRKSEKNLLARYKKLATQWRELLPNPFFAISVFGQAFKLYTLVPIEEGPPIISSHEWTGVLDRPGESQLREIAAISQRFAFVLPECYRNLSGTALQEQLAESLAKWRMAKSDPHSAIGLGPLRSPIKKELTL